MNNIIWLSCNIYFSEWKVLKTYHEDYVCSVNSHVIHLIIWENKHSKGHWLKYTARGVKQLPDHETAGTELDVTLLLPYFLTSYEVGTLAAFHKNNAFQTEAAGYR